MSLVSVEIDSKVNELFAKTNVTQKFKNQSNDPLELKIHIFKNDKLIFSSFHAKIGDSITVKSKVIKKEKAEIKYTDSISSGNAAIFVSEDPTDEKRIIINMGNIPANEEVIFTSEFIQFVESSKTYEFELFRNLPIFYGKSCEYQNNDLKGKISICTNNKIIKIEKDILMKELTIKEERFLNADKKNYLISYEISKLPLFQRYHMDNYIPSSKIYFELEMNQNSGELLAFCQKSTLNKDELNYVIHYTNKIKKTNDDILKINPALFIFLIDQSGSMSGQSIKIASEGLRLFLQSLPDKSFYQIIGFGSYYKAYDETPKPYTQENILKSLGIIDNLRADLGATDIYSPLKYVFESCKLHDTINLPRNIFLLTDGEIEDKKRTLDLIYQNSSKYSIYSIGIGNYFDEDLIKNAGTLGKGGYNFCKEIKGINKIIVKEINRAISPFYSNINIKSSLDNENLIKNQSIPTILRDNEIINLNYIINNNKESKNNKINFEINYLDNEEKIEKKYEIIPYYLPEGEELSKLIINNYLKNNNFKKDKLELELELKYQIFGKNTSLFAEIELSDKVAGELKEKILENQEDNQIKINKPINTNIFMNQMGVNHMNIGMIAPPPPGMNQNIIGAHPSMNYMMNQNNMMTNPPMNFMMNQNNMMMNPSSMIPKAMSPPPMNSMRMGDDYDDEEVCYLDFSNDNNNMMMNPPMNSIMNQNNMMMNPPMNSMMNQNNMMMNHSSMIPMAMSPPPMNSNNSFIPSSSFHGNEMKDIQETIDTNKKEDIMKIINTQDFINGFWEANNYTNIIKEKYKKEYDLLKGIKSKNITDRVAITFLIIYFIDKEHPELLDELLMIIKKAKIFIFKEAKDTYENIIKEISISYIGLNY